MRQNYATPGIVLGRRPVAEESILLTILTKDLGLIRARAQGLRKPGAKLAAALQTLSETDVTTVAGREGWKLSGAVLKRNWFHALGKEERDRASRVAALVLRLVPGEEADPELYRLFAAFLLSLTSAPPESREALECLAVLRILSALGLDSGDLPGTPDEPYGVEALRQIYARRAAYVARANKGIAASGL